MSRAAPAEIAEPVGLPPAAGVDWEAVYAENVTPVYRFVYSKTGNHPDAEDVTSQVFLQAIPYLRQARPEGTRAYLFATARTQLANYWRDRYGISGNSMDELAAPDVDQPHSQATERRIQCLLTRLPERYRRVLELRFLRGFSVRETAAEMHISSGNAKVMQLRALRRAAELGRDSSLCQT